LRPGRRRPLRECAAPRLARPLALARAEPPGGARGAPRAGARRGAGEPDGTGAPHPARGSRPDRRHPPARLGAARARAGRRVGAPGAGPPPGAPATLTLSAPRPSRRAPRPSAAGALLLLFGALGCGRDSRGGVVVELWAMGREGEVVAELMPGFERRHPGLRVRVQQIPWSAAHEKLVTAYVGGAMPDVFQAGNTWLPEFAALDALEPLDDRYGDFRSPAFRRAFDFYLDLFRRGLAPGTGEAAVANVYQDFAAGYFALYVSGPWNLGEFRQRLPPGLNGRWATAPLPAPDGGYPGVSLAGGASLAVFRRSPRKDAAWGLIEYLSEPAQQVRFYRLTGDLPARRSAWTEAALERDPQAGAFWTQLEAVRATPKIPAWERIATQITPHADAAVRG